MENELEQMIKEEYWKEFGNSIMCRENLYIAGRMKSMEAIECFKRKSDLEYNTFKGVLDVSILRLGTITQLKQDIKDINTGNELVLKYCNDKIKELQSKLQEKEQEIERLREDVKFENKTLKECVKDFAIYGTRHDMNPTGQFRDCSCFQPMSNDSWQGYINSQDKYVREFARQALVKINLTDSQT